MTSSTAASQLGFEPFASTDPTKLRTNGDVKAVIHAAYRQVFGNHQ